MTSKSRRGFLRSAAQLAAASAAMGAVPEGIRQALAIPAHNAHRNIEDVQHIVILMQENRSFDHYFGTLKREGGTASLRAQMLDFDGLNRTIGTPDLLQLGKKYDA